MSETNVSDTRRGSVTEIHEDFGEYVAARQRSLVRMAYLLTGQRESAEDLVQAALARTYLAWGRIRDKAAADGYVRKIMVREHIGWWRRAWRHRERTVENVPDKGATPAHDPCERDELWQLVKTLPPRQKAVVVLRFYEDLSEAQTAELLDCSIGTVKSQTSRALAKLRTRLGENEDPTYGITEEVAR